MTLLAILALLKFWLPLLTAAGIIWRAYRAAGKAMSGWANTLLDNHMAHIQDAAEKASAAVVELAAYHKDMIQSQRDMVNELREQRQDIRTLASKL